MTTAALAAVPAFAPVDAAVAVLARRRGPAGTHGLVPGLVVSETDEANGRWIPATELVNGARLDDLLAAAGTQWNASSHVAAALAWRSYTYWLAMPAVLGWAQARRVPDLTPDNVLVRFGAQRPLVTIGLRDPQLTVLPDDPLVGAPGVTVAHDEAQLLQALRETLRDTHLELLLARIRERVRLGTRTLWGSLASAVGYAAVRGLDRTPAEMIAVTDTILSTLGVADLVAVTPGPDGWPTVQRHTCCLAFSLPQPKVCSGCCLRKPDAA